LAMAASQEARLEDYVVAGLVDFDDICYDEHADLLYDLATQTVKHFQGYLSTEDARRVLRCYQKDIARFIHSQMQQHYWEEAAGYDVVVSKGFHRPQTKRLHRHRFDFGFSTTATGQIKNRPVRFRRLPAVLIPGAEIPI